MAKRQGRPGADRQFTPHLTVAGRWRGGPEPVACETAGGWAEDWLYGTVGPAVGRVRWPERLSSRSVAGRAGTRGVRDGGGWAEDWLYGTVGPAVGRVGWAETVAWWGRVGGSRAVRVFAPLRGAGWGGVNALRMAAGRSRGQPDANCDGPKGLIPARISFVRYGQ